MQFQMIVFLLILSASHLVAEKLDFLRRAPRNKWFSFAGGISLAYVFAHVLPELAHHSKTYGERYFLLALLGVAIFYGLERLAQRSHRTAQRRYVLSVHVLTFAIYNGLVGYNLHTPDEDILATTFYVVAMALHFLINDYGTHRHYGELYHMPARWILAAAPVVGWSIAAVTELPEHVQALTFGLLAGGIVVNVIKEEVPEENSSYYSLFLMGAVLNALLLHFTLQ